MSAIVSPISKDMFIINYNMIVFLFRKMTNIVEHIEQTNTHVANFLSNMKELSTKISSYSLVFEEIFNVVQRSKTTLDKRSVNIIYKELLNIENCIYQLYKDEILRVHLNVPDQVLMELFTTVNNCVEIIKLM